MPKGPELDLLSMVLLKSQVECCNVLFSVLHSVQVDWSCPKSGIKHVLAYVTSSTLLSNMVLHTRRQVKNHT